MNFRKKNSAVVIENAGESWKLIEADVGGNEITIRRASTVSRKNNIRDSLPAFNGHTDVSLVVGSDRSVCRLLKLPAASLEETRSMVAHRLETELPYPVADSLWSCERLNGVTDAESAVLVLATQKNDIVDTEKELGFAGRRPWPAQLHLAALAELALADSGNDVVAICRLNKQGSELAIVHAGKLKYARKLAASVSESPADGTFDAFCDELDQCIHHFALTQEAGEPKKIILVGEGTQLPGIAQLLGRRIGIPAQILAMPAEIRCHAGLSAELLVAQYPACLGALLAFKRGRAGKAAAAPMLRRSIPAFFSSMPRRRAALAGVGIVLLAAFIGISFAVRAMEISRTTSVVREGKPFLQDMELLQNEVDILEYEAANQRPMVDTLQALTDALPKTIKIATLNITPAGKITITGSAGVAEEVSDKAVEALRKSKLFANPVFGGATKDDKEVKFRLSCDLRSVGAAK